jgi:hypothetical protein
MQNSKCTHLHIIEIVKSYNSSSDSSCLMFGESYTLKKLAPRDGFTHKFEPCKRKWHTSTQQHKISSSLFYLFTWPHKKRCIFLEPFQSLTLIGSLNSQSLINYKSGSMTSVVFHDIEY